MPRAPVVRVADVVEQGRLTRRRARGAAAWARRSGGPPVHHDVLLAALVVASWAANPRSSQRRDPIRGVRCLGRQAQRPLDGGRGVSRGPRGPAAA
eukprot:5258235-Pyramimonas_sp.AAC.1